MQLYIRISYIGLYILVWFLLEKKQAQRRFINTSKEYQQKQFNL